MQKKENADCVEKMKKVYVLKECVWTRGGGGLGKSLGEEGKGIETLRRIEERRDETEREREGNENGRANGN